MVEVCLWQQASTSFSSVDGWAYAKENTTDCNCAK